MTVVGTAACARDNLSNSNIETSTVTSPLVADQEQKLIGTDTTLFGGSVAISSDYAFVGSIEPKSFSGSVVVYQRSGSSWSKSQTLTEASGDGDLLGASLAVDGDTLVAGASMLENGTLPGRVYVYRRTGTKWSQTQTLQASAGYPFDGFGYVVALSQGVLAVLTTEGEAYAFQDSGGSFTKGTYLDISDMLATAIDTDGTRIAVGLPSHTGGGAVYVFDKTGSGWNSTMVKASDSVSGDKFGTSVLIRGNTLFVGSPRNTSKAVLGKVYVFKDSSVGWSATATLTASDGIIRDYFGMSLAWMDGALLVGAPYDGSSQAKAGAAYWFFERNGGWQEEGKIAASDGSVRNSFGIAVAMSSTRAIVGAGPNIPLGYNAVGARAAYVFSLQRQVGDPCTQNDQCSSASCVNSVCSGVPEGGTGGAAGAGGSGGAGGAGAAAGSGAAAGTSGLGGEGGTAGAGAMGGANNTAGNAGSGEPDGAVGKAGGAATGDQDAGVDTPAHEQFTDTTDVSGFYACSTIDAHGGRHPIGVVLGLGLIALSRRRYRDRSGALRPRSDSRNRFP